MRPAAQIEAPIERIRHNLVGLRRPRALETLDSVVQQLERGQISAIKPSTRFSPKRSPSAKAAASKPPCRWPGSPPSRR